ncbi:hypothetical protein Rhe02_17240 [Rhizocola hellebori]|uniref:Uncharacterized protein n=1 Tax=Rhizocola hellebori TaxID=1392758 RepID=A0A8J3VEX3_9ACTN|nr:hypothetical protein [Rhizocola hellebori]GIH03657.1 hypothetical protein Rhe02_17240 [Rhizocola hellebori]
MFTKLLRRLTATGPTEFCDECAQVCTSACRAEAHYSRIREQAAANVPFIR